MREVRAGSIVTIGSNSGITARPGLRHLSRVEGGDHPCDETPRPRTEGIGGALQHGLARHDEHRDADPVPDHGSIAGGGAQRPSSAFPPRHPSGSRAELDDVCDLILFLPSDRARRIAMETFVLDGGRRRARQPRAGAGAGRGTVQSPLQTRSASRTAEWMLREATASPIRASR